MAIIWIMLTVHIRRSDKTTGSSRDPLITPVEEETETIIPVPPTNYDTI